MRPGGAEEKAGRCTSLTGSQQSQSELVGGEQFFILPGHAEPTGGGHASTAWRQTTPRRLVPWRLLSSAGSRVLQGVRRLKKADPG